MKITRINILILTMFFVGLGIFIPVFTQEKKDSVQLYEEVTIHITHRTAETQSTIRKEQIDQLAPQDVGTLLQFINGVTIKNYGGIGGMKTFSQRGLGGEHNQLLIDGMPINDPQSGQINFATIQPDNIEEISVNHLSQKELIPVSGEVKGSFIKIKTFDQAFSPKPFALRSNITVGSFGQKEAYVGLKHGGKNYFISASGGVGDYQGDYPYQLSFDTVRKYRKNNEVSNYFASIGAGYSIIKERTTHLFKLTAKSNYINQQLPGAVVLYNDLSKETLKTQNSNIGLNYKLHSGDIKLLAFANYENRFLSYYDPNYLNIDGFLYNKYTVNSLIGGFHLSYRWEEFSFHLGSDYSFDALESNRDLGNPQRHTSTSMAKSIYNGKFLRAEIAIFNQVYIDNNRPLGHNNTYSKFHPQLSIYTSDELLKNWQFFAWYKPSSRPPSFNDLYFSQVGNKELEPEETTQLNAGFKYLPSLKNVHLTFQANAFKNIVKNKILALPTKNLFIWSIQNVGKVDIYGADAHFSLQATIKKHWNISTQAGISYQKVIDISDKNSPTYKNQIAYTPELTGNAQFNIAYKNIGLHFSTLYIGTRFSLNENIDANRLSPYFNLDISGSYLLVLKEEKHKIRIQAGIKNVTNESYSFVRYFIMPGINYFIKLSYDLN